MRQPHQFLRLSGARATADGLGLSFTIETREGPTLDLTMPLVELGGIISFLILIAAQMFPMSTAPDFFVIPEPLAGLGFLPGPTAAETLLAVRLGGFALAFPIESSRLAPLAEELLHRLRLYSAQGPGH